MKGFVGALVLAVVFLGGSVLAAPANTPIAVTAIAVTAGEFFFKPAKIEVKAGKVEFVVTNKGAIEHDFHIFDVKEKEVVPDGARKGHGHEAMLILPGETKKFTYTLKAGKYRIDCAIPGHKEAGMTASLVVK